MSIEGPFGSAPKNEKPATSPVSKLNEGDTVLEYGVPTKIISKMRSAAGIMLKLESGGSMQVDDENEEVEVPKP